MYVFIYIYRERERHKHIMLYHSILTIILHHTIVLQKTVASEEHSKKSV